MKAKSEYPTRHGDQHGPNGSDPIPFIGFIHWGVNTDGDHLGLTLDARNGGSAGMPVIIDTNTDTVTQYQFLVRTRIGGWSIGSNSAFIQTLGGTNAQLEIHSDDNTLLQCNGILTIRGTLGISLNPGTGNALDLTTHRISNVVDPSSPQDAATKAYVDAYTTGGTIDGGSP